MRDKILKIRICENALVDSLEAYLNTLYLKYQVNWILLTGPFLLKKVFIG